jgi:serralysin
LSNPFFKEQQMLIKAKTKIDDPTAYNLTAGQDLLVGRDVVLQSNSNSAVIGSASGGHDVTVQGRILGFGAGIQIVSNGPNKVVVGETGSVSGVGIGSVGIGLSGNSAAVTNAGAVFGTSTGVYLGSGGTGKAVLNNSGTIIGATQGVLGDTLAKLTINNSGVIQGGITVTTGVANIHNSGEILGAVSLGDGKGLFDNSKGGVVLGTVNGGGGNDTFRAGRSSDYFEGGDGIDTMDYRAAKGAVWVDLEDPGNNRGWAKGDAMGTIEILVGSNAGGDRLAGYLSAGTDLRGIGGADTILGGNVGDRINGGLGKDVLSGFLGDDMFIYGKASEGGDVITDFQSGGVAEFIAFARGGFGFDAGGVLSAVKPGAFHESTTNRAGDAGDRFIWESDATRLWYDRDGTGGRYAPVMIANLQAGATLTAADILIL